METRKAVLLILDGIGYSEDPVGNVVTAEHMPALFAAMRCEGFALLAASGPAVGLEAGHVGNSEAGHVTLGAGRAVPSTSIRIDAAYRDGTWLQHPGWESLRGESCLHIVGLVSDAGVHGLARTIVQSVDTAARLGVEEILVHAVLDGVDSSRGTAPTLLASLRKELQSFPSARLGVVLGRRPFCDRSGDLEPSRVAAGALTSRTALPRFTEEALARHVEKANEADFPPALAGGGRTMRPGEFALITSHRADRARQILAVLGETQRLLAMVDPGSGIPVEQVFFPQRPLEGGIAGELRRHGVSSVRIAEKCKFPHVTYFLNGFDAAREGRGVQVASIPESEIAARPEMSIDEVLARVDEVLGDPSERALVVNVANLDQVGHVGRLEPAVRAAHIVDKAFEHIHTRCRTHGWTLLALGDHGNADRVVYPDGSPAGAHTDRPVPCLVLPAGRLSAAWREKEGTLANVTATFLLALGLEPPAGMEPALVAFSASEVLPSVRSGETVA